MIKVDINISKQFFGGNMVKAFLIFCIIFLFTLSGFSQNQNNTEVSNQSVIEFSFSQIMDTDAMNAAASRNSDEIHSLTFQKVPDVIMLGIHAGIGFCDFTGYSSHYHSSAFSYFLSARLMYLFADAGRLGLSAGISWIRNGFDHTSSYEYYTHYPEYFIRMDNISVSMLFSGLYEKVYFGAGPYASYSFYTKTVTAEVLRPDMNRFDFGLEIEAGYFHQTTDTFGFMFGINIRAGLRTISQIGKYHCNNFSFHAIVGFMFNNVKKRDTIVENNFYVNAMNEQKRREQERNTILAGFDASKIPDELLKVKTDILGTRYYFKGVELEERHIAAALDSLSGGLSALILESGKLSRKALQFHLASLTIIPFTGYAISDDNLDTARSHTEIAVEIINQALLKSANARKNIYPSLLVLYQEKFLQMKNEQNSSFTFLGFRIGGGRTFVANVEGLYESFQFGLRYMHFFPLKNTFFKLGFITDFMINTCMQREIEGKILYLAGNLLLALKYKRLYISSGMHLSILLHKKIPESLYLNNRAIAAFVLEPGVEILKSPKLFVGLNLKIYFKKNRYTEYDGSVPIEKFALPSSISAHISVGF